MVTEKQEKFVQGIASGKSQRTAYKAAYNCKNMKPATIDKRASELLKNNGEVTGRLNELRQKAIKDDEDTAISMQKLIIEQEKAILKADLGDLVKISGNESKDGLITIPKRSLKKFDTRAIQEMHYDRSGNLVVKLYDKQAAARLLMDVYGITAQESSDDNFEVQIADELKEYLN